MPELAPPSLFPGALVAALAALNGALGATPLPSPARMLVEHLSQPAGNKNVPPIVISTTTPRLTFAPHSAFDHPGAAVAMSAYRIVVTNDQYQLPAWDSGIVNASAAVSVKCATALDSMTSYSWTAQWW